MSRAIGFRAWFQGEMLDVYAVNPMNHTVYLSCLKLNGREGDDVLVGWNDGIETEGCELMQYTSLKDKNGREIYEGDILAAKFHHSFVDRVHWKGEPEAICEVRWDYSGFRLTARSSDDERYVDFWDFTDPYSAGNLVMMENTETEVIGNIYENAELLQENK